MDGVVVLGIIVAGLTLLGILAGRYGVDSRYESDDARQLIRYLG